MSSAQPKYINGTLAVVNQTGRIVLVDHATGSSRDGIVYSVWDRGRLSTHFEAELRTTTFREFAMFRHPRTGRLMSGKTRGYMAAIIHLFTLLLFGGSLAQEASWWSAAALLPIAGYWFGTWKNWTGQWR